MSQFEMTLFSEEIQSVALALLELCLCVEMEDLASASNCSLKKSFFLALNLDFS